MLTDELGRLAYADQRSPLQRALDWIDDQLQSAGAGSGGPLGRLLLALGAVALVVVIGIVLSRLRRTGTVRANGGRDVLMEQDLTAADYRARAAAHEDQGRFDEAVLDWFRAIAARADERVLLGQGPARTAHEIGAALAPRFPAKSTEIRGAADLFDAVLYGSRTVEPADSARVRQLDQDLTQMPPGREPVDHSEAPVAPGRWAP